MRLVVIDAANCFYRAFFAIPPLRTAGGFPTNALLGFANMLRKVIREERPDGVVIAADPPGGSFRRELYPDYKANRDAQPEDLSAQFPVLREMAEALGIPILEVKGFEADDVVATLVAKAPKKSELLIVSTDKDLMQLVSASVCLLDTMKDRRVGPAEVEARFGVGPDQLLDLRSLVGDPSDNIPGVKGIGEKGAAKLIGEWGNLESLLDNASEIKAKRAREALQNEADNARLSKKLATLRTDVPIEWDGELFACRPPDTQALGALFARLEFTRLLEDFGGEGESGGAELAVDGLEVSVVYVDKASGLTKAGAALAKASQIAWALPGPAPTGGLPEDAVGLAFATAADQAYYLDVSALGAEAIFEELSKRMASKRAPQWLGLDTKVLRSFFAERGVSLGSSCFDVSLASFLLDPAQKRSPEAVAARELDRKLTSWEDLAGKGAKAKSPEEIPARELADFCGAQAAALLELSAVLGPKLEAAELDALFREVELPLSEVLSEMERAGVRVDENVLARLEEEFSGELERIESRIYELAGETFSIGSPKQLQKILFEKLSLPVIKKTKTGYSTDESVLEQLSSHHELPGYVLAHRRLAKLCSTYVVALPPLVSEATGRIHPSFIQTGAATGRLSSSNPNVQNIPIRSEDGIRIREAFVPAEGSTLLSADYSQVELRVLAHFSEDESLIEAFRTGEDIHRRTAAEVAGIEADEVDDEGRARAKAVNFGIIYGLSSFGLAQQLGIASAEAQETINAYFERYAGVKRFLTETRERAKEEGYVSTLLGRRRYLPDLASRNRVLRSAAERMAVNTVIQGSAADLIKMAMVAIAADLREGVVEASMILQVHDELVFEVAPRSEAKLRDLVRSRMEGVHELRVPLVVEMGSGKSWREAH